MIWRIEISEKSKKDKRAIIVKHELELLGLKGLDVDYRTVYFLDIEAKKEVIEEVVRIPKAQKEIKINRQEMVNKLAKLNQERLMTLLFP